MRLAALRLVLCVLVDRASAFSAVVVLRGDSFRFGTRGDPGCQLHDASVANQMHQLGSVVEYLIAPLARRDGAEVHVTGVIYSCAMNDRIEALLRQSAWVASSTLKQIARDARVSQRTAFRLALEHARALHPRAAFYLVTRLDITYGTPVAPAAPAWSVLDPLGFTRCYKITYLLTLKILSISLQDYLPTNP